MHGKEQLGLLGKSEHSGGGGVNKPFSTMDQQVVLDQMCVK